jgi:hypothetical protein
MRNNAAIAKKGDTMTIAGALESILSFVSERDNDDLPFEADEETVMTSEYPQKEYDYVCGKLDITPVQAELFAAILELSVNGNATPENLARKIGCTNLHLINHNKEIDVLCKKRYVRNTTGFRGQSYKVPPEVINSIQNDKMPDGEDISGLSTTGILRRMNRIFRNFWREEINREGLESELFDLVSYNPDSVFVKEYERLRINTVPDYERLLFFLMICRLYGFNTTSFGWEEVSKLFEDEPEEDIVQSGLQTGELQLARLGIIENVNNDGIVDSEHVCFVDGIPEQLLSEVKFQSGNGLSCRGLIGKDAIQEKSLFFNDSDRGQIETLASLLQKDNFSKVIERLSEKKMRPGFCCLFYGEPGTGKTESVYQIARRTGRDIFLVNVSQIKSKWVGESEKNISALFCEYKNIVKNKELAPILLFNEADAIFGVRKSGAEDAVDKMENSIQNIILQEMESLRGILIATTNLTQNLDPAFERRFIYKVNFHKPDKEARLRIWTSLMEGIDESDARMLADSFDFSGGQIENISRKATVDFILSGKRPDIDGLRRLCDNEIISSRKGGRARIGF